MTEPRDIRDDLESGIDEDLVVLAEHLRDARPVPRPTFRGDLGRQLAAHVDRGFGARRVRAAIATCSLTGILLLCIGAVSAAGVGPLG